MSDPPPPGAHGKPAKVLHRRYPNAGKCSTVGQPCRSLGALTPPSPPAWSNSSRHRSFNKVIIVLILLMVPVSFCTLLVRDCVLCALYRVRDGDLFDLIQKKRKLPEHEVCPTALRDMLSTSVLFCNVPKTLTQINVRNDWLICGELTGMF